MVPATASAEEILERKPDGVFLSNGPGDPAATGEYAVPEIKKLVGVGPAGVRHLPRPPDAGPRASAPRRSKMHQGHHGANHPVKDFTTGKVEITSMNHGFAVDRDTLPAEAEETHVSLFDGSNCGLRLKGKPVFSVQYHPEASPGPEDSHYLFTRFVNLMRERKGLTAADRSGPGGLRKRIGRRAARCRGRRKSLRQQLNVQQPGSRAIAKPAALQYEAGPCRSAPTSSRS